MLPPILDLADLQLAGLPGIEAKVPLGLGQQGLLLKVAPPILQLGAGHKIQFR